MELKQNYIGSLVSRLSNLVLGSKGLMLNCPRSVDFSYLAQHNVVLELVEIKSGEEKSFIMGLILSRMAAIIKSEHKKNNHYRHVTLVEEAHRLLSKVGYGDSGAKKNAVEAFTDLLAEVRKYGEGLVIVDQIPNKLTSEVLKNTNTKIIHRILARDDKEAVGDTMLMNDKQKEYLSALGVGDAVIFTEITDNPVNVHIKPFTNTNEEQVDDEEVEKNFELIKNKLGDCYGRIINNSVLKKYSELKLWLSRPGTDRLLREAKIIYEHIVAYANKTEFSKNVFWKTLVAKGDIFDGSRYSNFMKDYKLYIDCRNSLSQFFAEDFSGAITSEQIAEYKKTNYLLVFDKNK